MEDKLNKIFTIIIYILVIFLILSILYSFYNIVTTDYKKKSPPKDSLHTTSSIQLIYQKKIKL